MKLKDKTELEKFFSTLATRIYRENAASDVLYAGLLSSPVLFSIIANKIGFPPTQIKREYFVRDSQPDFLFKSESGKPVLLEVKLFDRNYHYKQYSKIIVEDIRPRIFLLTIHRPSQNLFGWTVVTWRELINKMEMSGDSFMLSLARYFREVTMEGQLKPISLDRLTEILYLNRAVKYVIRSYESKRSAFAITKTTKDFGEEYSGYYYLLKSTSNNKTALLWFGLIYYSEDHQGITLWLDKKRNKLYNKIENALRKHYKSKFIQENGSCSIMMEIQKLNELLSCKDLKKQLGILTSFFTEFNRVVERCL